VTDEVQVVPLPQILEAWPHGTETILVVDDRAAVRDLVRETLEPCGYRIIEAEDGQDGLEVFELCAKEINLVITDLIMPRLGGAELGRLIKKQHPETKVIYMSGYSGESAVLETPFALLEKPFTPEALARRVREELGSKCAQKSILIADDDRDIRNLLRSVLENEGYEVHTASNGKEAVALLGEKQVGVVLTDLAMPERDGIEMMVEVRKEYPDLKIIAMSGRFAGPVLDSAKRLGANAILTKPLRVDELLKTLQHLR
jgi:CheY-like chemotaxis protein